ncbi:phosphoethanolamine transferase [Mitsuokella sp. AF21-1AC]|uniref:phosphoethanolamine transferase n=1 Tax=Mitsuokella sp. AF21-1AC TaxID=2292235 RepID=UPI001F45C4F1|nr:phosphoethanolamine transferase [Mitsuokella sp. AF21-1AC]
MPALKRFLLRAWARGTHIAEHEAGLLAVLYVLNLAPIAWLNIHMYKGEQLGVLAADAVFLLGGVLLYILVLGFIPVRRLRRFLFAASFFLSLLLGGLEFFSIVQYSSLIGAGIVTAVLQTNPREAGEFLRMYMGWQGVAASILLVAAGVFIYRRLGRCRIPFLSRHRLSHALPFVFLASLLAGTILLSEYYSFIINDSLDVPVVRVSRAATTSVENIQAFEKLKNEAASDVEITENRSDTPYVVFILGESTNRARMHLYGYPLENTPNLDELAAKGELAVFRDTISPEAATVAVLRKLLTFADMDSSKPWYEYNNMIDVMKAAGYRTYWLSNQESSGIWGNVAQLFAGRSHYSRFTRLRESHEDNGIYDEALFPLVDEVLAQPAAKNFYVIHLMGGHGLYYMRFPYLFSKFTADDVPPPQDTLSLEKRTEIAQYENALFYNDFVVTSLMGKFADKDALVVYIPDHGEAVYDHGSFSGHVEEHPTKETLEVPMIFWASPAYRAHHPEKWQALQAAVNRPYMTDDFIHTLLDLLDIRTPEYDAKKSVINPAFVPRPHRMVQGHDYDTEMK